MSPVDTASRNLNLAEAPPAAFGRLSRLVFGAKALGLQARRAAVDLGAGLRRHDRASAEGFPILLGEARTPLWGDADPGEQALQAGKVENLRRAARALDGIAVPADALFSFWRQVGRASPGRGYVRGRMLQEGCLIPSVGGGLCQLSNALYDVALQSGCLIVERHPHSRIVPGSTAAVGRDATVAWNYVDLRFRPRQAIRLEARLTADALVMRVWGAQARAPGVTQTEPSALGLGLGGHGGLARSCASCDQVDCHRHEPGPPPTAAPADRAAFLLDESWPEFHALVAEAARASDVLAVPVAQGRAGGARRAWPRVGAVEVRSAPITAARRSLAMRGARTGAASRAAELAGAERLAAALDRFAPPEARRLVVAQSLLPYLWRDGRLGGREVTVLMTRLPLAVLQARLDAAFAAHPERASLGDFRADPELAQWEALALDHARELVSPHQAVLDLFPQKARALAWRLPPAAPRVPPAPGRRRIVFPGPTVARKGAYELRDAARALDLEVVLLGAELEGPGFWAGVRTVTPASGEAWLDGVCAVVQPALVEHAPRRLLSALAAGVPVVATPACGLAGYPGLTLVGEGDGPGLETALARLIDGA
jgi:hypothetical protein